MIKPFTWDNIKRAASTFAFAAGAYLLTNGPGLLKAPNMKNQKALLYSLVAGTIGAGFSAAKNWWVRPAILKVKARRAQRRK